MTRPKVASLHHNIHELAGHDDGLHDGLTVHLEHDFHGVFHGLGTKHTEDAPHFFGDVRGRRRGRLRHHLVVESAAVPDFRGDFCVFDVLWRVIFSNLAQFVKSTG